MTPGDFSKGVAAEAFVGCRWVQRVGCRESDGSCWVQGARHSGSDRCPLVSLEMELQSDRLSLLRVGAGIGPYGQRIEGLLRNEQIGDRPFLTIGRRTVHIESRQPGRFDSSIENTLVVGRGTPD